MFAVRALLLFVALLSNWACAAPESHLDQHQVQIVSAHCYVFKSKAEDGTIIRNWCEGRATEKTLSLLEEVVLRRARVDRHHLVFPPGNVNLFHRLAG